MTPTPAPIHSRPASRRCPLAVLLAGVLLAGAGKPDLPAAAPALPPNASFVHLSDNEGLAHSDVRAIAQDHEGFIWFGLRLGGLTRYDGYDLQVYAHDPADPRSIGNQIIWALLVDRQGALWIGTEGGLDRFDRATNSFAHFRHDASRPDSLAHNVVTCLFEDAAGRIWAGTRDGLCRLDDPVRGSFTTYRRPPVVAGSSANDTYRSITEDPTTGLLWLGASDGLAAFDPRTGAFASYLHDPDDPTSVSRNAVNKVMRDEHGTFWALTEDGLNSFAAGFNRVTAHSLQEPRIAFRRYRQPADDAYPGTNFVRDGLVDRQHRLWLATRGGVAILDRATGEFTMFRRQAANPNSLSDDLTQAIFEDRSGTIWIATYSGGVNRLRSEAKPFRTHRHVPGNPRSLTDDRVSGLAIAPDGRLWAATANGISWRDADGWTRFQHDPANPDSLPSNDISTIAVGPDGDVWAGSNYRGLYRFDQARFHSYPTSSVPAPNGSHPFTGVQVNSLLPAADGSVWIGARAHGLDHLQDGRFRHFNPQEATGDTPAQPTTNAVLGFLTPQGDLWFATEAQGLVRLDARTGRFTAFQPPVILAGTARSLHCVAQQDDGFIWLGAADGLLKFDPRTATFVRQYTTNDGLPHAAVMTIVPDRRGHLWLGTADGLADFNPATETFRTYEKPDGLPANVFSQRTGVLGPDGRVYLGTRAGIVEFAPGDLRDNPEPPPVVLTGLRWLGEPPADANGRRSPTVLNLGPEIRIPPGQPGFGLTFSALDYTAPAKNRFRYQLEGWNSDWIAATARDRTATYTALPPGDYIFRVRGSNADQVWNETGATIRIVVEPHFWQTVWFRMVLVASALGLLLAGMRARTRVIRQRNVQLSDQVSQRTAQLQEEIATRERAEIALRESHAELEQRVQTRTAELAQSNLSLQAEIAERTRVESQLRQAQKMEAIGQIAGGVAHDFNNVLTVILGQSALLGEGRLTPVERDAAVRDIRDAAQRASNLTRQLLVLSRHQALAPVPADLNTIATAVSKLLVHVIGENIELVTVLHPAPLGVSADAGMLEQVLLNLALNARDAMPRGGRLTIVTTQLTFPAGRRHPVPALESCARVSVCDTGTGIPDEILPQIFEPFFTTKEAGKGTGLGLAISHGIAQKHGGWIDVETKPDVGTTFHVTLPAHALPAPAATPVAPPPARSGNGTTILIAEDEPAVRKLVQRLLTRHGYDVFAASSAAEALELWAAHRDEIKILLTDIVMPGELDGHDLAARLQAERPDLRVVTMSGYDPTDVARDSGPSRPHVRKPFSADDLLTALDATLRA